MKSYLRVMSVWTCVVAVLSGCASPYVDRPRLNYNGKDHATSLSATLKYSQDTREAYRAKIIELGESERLLSNALISLGGALIAAGAFDAHVDTLVGGGLLGGTAYSLGVFNTDKRRAAIYIVGMKALTCAESAASPLNFDEAASIRVKENISAVNNRIVRVTNAISAVEDLIQQIEAIATTTSTQTAQQEIQSARQVIAKAISAQGAADQLVLQRSIAGGRLKTAVDEIDTLILDAIRGTEGALQAVPQVIAGLVKAGQIFVPQFNLADAIKPASKDAPHGLTEDERLKSLTPQLARMVATLKGEVALLESEAARLTLMVAAVDPAKALEALKACKVEGLPVAMTADTAELEFKAKTPDKKTVVIDGGAEPYYTYVEGSPPGLSVEQPHAVVVIVIANDQTVAGTYRLIVQDKTRQKRLIVTIKVTSGESNTRAPGTSTSTGDEYDRLVADINAKRTVKVNTTDVPIKAEKQPPPSGKVEITYTLPEGSSIATDMVKNVLETAFNISNRINIEKMLLTRGQDAAPHGLVERLRWGPVIQTLKRDQVMAIQRRLCLTGDAVDGRWGNTTQGALEADRARRRSAGVKDIPRGMLTSGDVVTLLSGDAAEAAAWCKR